MDQGLRQKSPYILDLIFVGGKGGGGGWICPKRVPLLALDEKLCGNEKGGIKTKEIKKKGMWKKQNLFFSISLLGSHI
jgi:hypothetical protein